MKIAPTQALTFFLFFPFSHKFRSLVKLRFSGTKLLFVMNDVLSLTIMQDYFSCKKFIFFPQSKYNILWQKVTFNDKIINETENGHEKIFIKVSSFYLFIQTNIFCHTNLKKNTNSKIKFEKSSKKKSKN